MPSSFSPTTTAVLLDTKGPEIRSGFFAEGKKINLVKGETIVLTSDYSYKGDNKKLACSYQSLAKSVTPGQEILVADGSLVLTVLSCDIPAGEVTCRIENNASIGERKNMNLPGVVVDLPTLTEKDINDIQNWGIPNDVDFIAASFVRKAEDVLKIREVLGEAGKGIKIISKIENQEGMENYDAILEVTTGDRPGLCRSHRASGHSNAHTGTGWPGFAEVARLSPVCRSLEATRRTPGVSARHGCADADSLSDCHASAAGLRRLEFVVLTGGRVHGCRGAQSADQPGHDR